ncbi:hypothetical protein [Streptantibioticus cattleyicolor]|uniref:hypothetical protein n=1 Tax=Streptantibioticus cattleyicolor TaxID=29303 RepID=UPI001E50FC83|nr:hypothetical protein [Streptantibioticus cattleyicolor]
MHDNTIHALGTNLLEQLRAEGGLQTAATREPTETVELATAHLPAPVPVPPAVRNITTFEHHISNTGKAAGGHGTVSPVWHEHPLFSFSNPAAIKRPHDKIPIAPDARSWDYEVKAAAAESAVAVVTGTALATLATVLAAMTQHAPLSGLVTAAPTVIPWPQIGGPSRSASSSPWPPRRPRPEVQAVGLRSRP